MSAEKHGFSLPADFDTCTIRFDVDSPWLGAVVKTVRRATLSQALEWDRLNRIATEGAESEDDERSIYDMLVDFGEKYLLAWNLLERHLDDKAGPSIDEDGLAVVTYVKGEDGEDEWFSVPCTAEALMRQPVGFALDLFSRHIEEVSGVSVPLEASSSDTPPSEEPKTPPPASASKSRRVSQKLA